MMSSKGASVERGVRPTDGDLSGCLQRTRAVLAHPPRCRDGGSFGFGLARISIRGLPAWRVPLDGLKSWASSQAYCKGDSDGGYEPTQDHGRRTRSRRTQDPSSTAAESRRDRQARLRDLSVAWRVAR